MEEKVAGRFAPSPSGRLHLGNLFCSLLAWLSAKSRGGRVVLRIEDLDPARTSRAFADQLERDLEFLGLFWDEGGSGGGPHAPYYQSERAPLYEQCLAALEARGLVYPCFCSRAQLPGLGHISGHSLLRLLRCLCALRSTLLCISGPVCVQFALCRRVGGIIRQLLHLRQGLFKHILRWRRGSFHTGLDHQTAGLQFDDFLTALAFADKLYLQFSCIGGKVSIYGPSNANLLRVSR